MNVASGTIFDGRGLLLLILVVVITALAFRYFWRLTEIPKEPVVGTGPKLTFIEMDQVLRDNWKPVQNAEMLGYQSPLWHLLTDEQIHGSISETPMSFYDWANERPMPVVNW